MAQHHAISFKWQGFEPHLLYYDLASKEMLELDLSSLDIQISHHSSCVGTWQGGDYRPCPNEAKVSGGNICQDCASTFLPELSCTFEPLCDGELCANRFCQQEHAVYLGFHGEIAKVGMTTARRVEQRVIEQGCDAFSVLAKVDGRASARKLEGALSENLGLRQRIREIEGLFQMTEEPRPEVMEEKYDTVCVGARGIGLKPGPLRFLEGYPISMPLDRMPKLANIGGRHRGRVIGKKGKFLIYQNGGLNALNLQNMPGRLFTTY